VVPDRARRKTGSGHRGALPRPDLAVGAPPSSRCGALPDLSVRALDEYGLRAEQCFTVLAASLSQPAIAPRPERSARGHRLVPERRRPLASSGVGSRGAGGHVCSDERALRLGPVAPGAALVRAAAINGRYRGRGPLVWLGVPACGEPRRHTASLRPSPAWRPCSPDGDGPMRDSLSCTCRASLRCPVRTGPDRILRVAWRTSSAAGSPRSICKHSDGLADHHWPFNPLPSVTRPCWIDSAAPRAWTRWPRPRVRRPARFSSDPPFESDDAQRMADLRAPRAELYGRPHLTPAGRDDSSDSYIATDRHPYRISGDGPEPWVLIKRRVRRPGRMVNQMDDFVPRA